MTTLHTFKVGDRVKLLRDVDRFPDFIAPAGMLGTVDTVELDGSIAVKMDATIAGCEEWDNCICWYDVDSILAMISDDLAHTGSITMAQAIAYFAGMMNSIRESEGHPPYTEQQVRDCWETMPAEERAEWEDEALDAHLCRDR